MNRAAVAAYAQQYRRAGVDPPPAATPWGARWYVKLALSFLTAGLLTAAFAPASVWPLAWVGLVPWLLVVGRTRSAWTAFGWSWVAGTLFFIANMWWMSAVTVPGMIGLMAILGLYWGYAGIIVRGAGLVGAEEQRSGGAEGRRGGGEEEQGGRAAEGQTEAASDVPSAPQPLRSSAPPPLRPFAPPLLRSSPLRSPTLRVLLLAATWVAASEWFRGTWPWHGLPWLYLGYTQTPALVLCQSADLFGVEGLSFVIVAANAWVAMWVLNRLSLRRLAPAGLVVLGLIGADVGYGLYRVRTERRRFVQGPTVLVVQPDYPQSNSGAKGASAEKIVEDHRAWTQGYLGSHAAGSVDLIVWSETMMPPINDYARHWLYSAAGDAFVQDTYRQLQDLCYDYRVGLLTGGEFVGRFAVDDNTRRIKFLDRSNVVYSFDRHGVLDEQIYTKIHLVPFGEFIPFKEGFPALYRLAVRLGPPDMTDYELIGGSEDKLTVFDLRHDPEGPTANAPPWRYVTPICFEDIDADLCAKMFRPDGTTGGRKRADFLVNVTNDGWFMANENAQHLQAAVFRSIENRVPTARSVNTGISGFVDPLGQTHYLIEARTVGTRADALELDDRVTLFTRTGQRFAQTCAAVTVLTALASIVGWAGRRRRRATAV